MERLHFSISHNVELNSITMMLLCQHRKLVVFGLLKQSRISVLVRAILWNISCTCRSSGSSPSFEGLAHPHPHELLRGLLHLGILLLIKGNCAASVISMSCRDHRSIWCISLSSPHECFCSFFLVSSRTRS